MRARKSGYFWMKISLVLAKPKRVKKRSREFAIHKVE